MCPGPPSGVPGLTTTPASPRAATTSPSSASPRSIQEKFAWESGVVEPELAHALLDEDSLDDGPLDALRDVILVADRLRARRLGQGVDAERLAHRVERRAELAEVSA